MSSPVFDLPGHSDILDAAQRLTGHAVRTPLLRNDWLDDRLGARLFVKAECLQRTGSFKFRGAYNRISRLSDAEKQRGVIAYSSGNHAQGVAAAARLVGTHATILMPTDAPAAKVEGVRFWGGKVVTYDRASESREAAEPEGFDDHKRSLAAGHRVANDRLTGSICDAIITPTPGELTWQLNSHQLSGGVAVSDDEVLQAMALAWRHLKIVIEPGAVVALAAVLSGKLDIAGKTVCVLATGGNVDRAMFARALELG